ncbi:hypothetical protein L0B52_00485 [Suttonella sp. R2A3]|uniref:glycerophosphodiester phosphodiesterase n=1 Tax=Suttonella sp. R2A3 TaxID=2908648 RepID=UPI001F21C86D|nr:glycerophosphodiester phosphodiesterase family protein [Suttonella sp. R2A3]UJF24653.1 hypothetical protein L0B52_00485 [Suttonella sp. R2A3]
MSQWIAHRGLSAVAPENTWAAFELAWAHDCDGIELDVQVSRDGVVYVHHDESLLRTAGQDLNLADSDAVTLDTADVGSWFAPEFAGQRLPRLAEVIAMMPVGKIIQVEIKPDVENLAAIAKVLNEARRDVTIYMISFNQQVLCKLAALVPDLPTLWVIDEAEARTATVFELAKEQRFSGIDVNEVVVDQDYVHNAHAHGLILGVWTVNDASRKHTLATFGVDMIASDNAHQQGS